MKKTLGLVALTAAGVVGGLLVGRLLFGPEVTGTIVEAGDPTYGLGEDFSHLVFTDLSGGTHTLGDHLLLDFRPEVRVVAHLVEIRNPTATFQKFGEDY